MDLQSVFAAHPQLLQVLQPCNPAFAASVFGGLLTEPTLQRNCNRLEVLAHAAVAIGSGKKKLSKAIASTWFSELSSGPCGAFEDPAEDGFASIVNTPRGGFRIVRGVWESADFFLERFINIVEAMPSGNGWDELKESLYALLQLSDLVCERSNLSRYVFENSTPLPRLSKEILSRFDEYRKRVTFTESELNAVGVSPQLLKPFVLPPTFAELLAESSTTHSPLLHHPLLHRDGNYIVALPTAISIALRTMILGSMLNEGLLKQFVKALGQEYERHFKKYPPFGIGRNGPIFFRPTDNGVIASFSKEIESGHWYNVILVLDTLEGFADSGFAGSNPNPAGIADDIEHEIDECRKYAQSKEGYRRGLTLIVGCGIGRASAYALGGKKFEDWCVKFMSAADLARLSLLNDIKPQKLWRLHDAEQKLAMQNVRLFNLNGLPNLIALERALDGHLVDHAQVPEQFGTGQPCEIVVDPTMIYDFRAEIAGRIDRHSVFSPKRRWTEIRKTGDSFFDEERDLPLYVWCEHDPESILPIVFISQVRSWWCHVLVPHDLQRWKILTTWLPKIAIAVDGNVKDLSADPVTLRILFGGFGQIPDIGELPTQTEIKESITIKANLEEREVLIETGMVFERGLASPSNISEAALVQAIVEGMLNIAGHATPDAYAKTLLTQIVPDELARSCHMFFVQTFRDFVRESLPRSTVTVDSIDDASHRLGLGWSIRNRSDGPEINGKSECTAFLNKLVESELQSLCHELGRFDRRRLIELALNNHEAAMVHQATWRRTAAANLSLHSDKPAALDTITDQEFLNNAALQASRVLIELAVCECPLESGSIPCEMDLSKLMAILLHAMGKGGWSDAIHRDVLPAEVYVTPLGDVQVDSTFFDTIVEPFGRESSETIIQSSMSEYAINFEQPRATGAVEPNFDPAFVSAWTDEFGFGIDAMRCFADQLDDKGINEKLAIFSMRKSEAENLLNVNTEGNLLILNKLSTVPRPAWRTVSAEYVDQDRFPWRFRRRLSLLRLPIIQLDDSDDPELLIAPGLVRDAIGYTVRGYHDGSFPLSQIRSPAMKSWVGNAARSRGSEFTSEVDLRMVELGWKTEKEAAVTKILGKGFAVDYGDVDVLAWSEADSRVLLVECKHLYFAKTPGELAEQLTDFRGLGSGRKRDLLKKHIDRCEVISLNVDALSHYIGLEKISSLERWVVFRNPVPMIFAQTEHGKSVRFTTFDKLGVI